MSSIRLLRTPPRACSSISRSFYASFADGASEEIYPKFYDPFFRFTETFGGHFSKKIFTRVVSLLELLDRSESDISTARQSSNTAI
jgi:hypothetical protein